MEWLSLVLFVLVCIVLMSGYPVALVLAGTSLLFAGACALFGAFDTSLFNALPIRLFGIINNQTLLAVPLFVFMGLVLEKSKIAEDLLLSISSVFGRYKAGLGLSVILVGMLLAASTGIVGATVVTMGVLSLPAMLKQKYPTSLAAGTICATGTLGQIIPPSIALVLLGDVISSAYQQSQINMGIFSPETVSVGDLFVGAVIPGLILVACYAIYVCIVCWRSDTITTATKAIEADVNVSVWAALLPPLGLILIVLGSILLGFATPTEAAGVGAFGAILLALCKRKLNFEQLKTVSQSTVKISSMIFLILIGASIFSLVFRGLGGEELIHSLFENMPGGVVGATLVVMLVIFLLGFILDFIEITFVVVPIVAPVLLSMGIDPVWLGIMIALNLQTSFLTPPFGFALFYLRGVAPASVKTIDIYKGVMPFIGIQLFVLLLLALWPEIATWLPEQVY
ncbi:TRAP transporter large permease [Algibacillus agarilyticus]|uniref:TRAP transporter large permease n=1 Tax=Algibacillus agarilyticus TaxID=2234133 RepID=UPI000DCFA3B6|nr:TRAP transporter large permease subunit [Algibacillus agarilyticus]